MAHLRPLARSSIPIFLAPRLASSTFPRSLPIRLSPGSSSSTSRLLSTTRLCRNASVPPSPPPLSTTASSSTAGMRDAAAQLSPEARRKLQETLHKRREEFYSGRSEKVKSVVMYTAATLILTLGITYAAVPLYRAFCSATGFGGIPITTSERFDPSRMYSSHDPSSLMSATATSTDPERGARTKKITVHFEATASDVLKWRFTPQQRFVKVLPGETALAFYTAENWGDEDVVGIATYNTTPGKMAPYFAKVECFCFEQQKIRAGETVDLPVFFFIDKDIDDDPTLDGVDDVVLSYTFFKARRNDQGYLEPDAPLDVVEKASGFEGYELAKK